MSAVARVRDLHVELPDGTPILEAADIDVHAGEVISILGPSGVGKSTLLRALFWPDDLKSRGYVVTWSDRGVDAQPAFVPQRGALLDHLDVAGNIAVAEASGGESASADRQSRGVEAWLAAVDLDSQLAEAGRSVASLSGGQAQRVAIARALAAGRRLLVLDEPSVGLDPLGVRLLARLLITQARQHDAGILIITHDLALAAGASDSILFLDPSIQALVPPVPDWKGPAELEETDVRTERLAELDAAIEELLLRERPQAEGRTPKQPFRMDPLAPFRVAGESLLRFFEPRLLRESAVVLRLALAQALLRPLLFYATVGVLLGITIPYILVHISDVLRPSSILGLIGGTYILALAPPLSAILFAATSGSAMSAWLGGLRLHGQVVALEGLGIPPARYLWSPAWIALALSYLITVALFASAMIAGGLLLFNFYEVPGAFAKLTSDFVDAPASRTPYLIRAGWLVFSYAFAVASIVVAKGSELKEKSEQVTSAMTSAVMRATLFVVFMELVTVAVLYRYTGRGR
jgi:ABC-type nitrate/sulfonate/bicarbonate transport system ATPase subunit/ABC-type transporter Mla maintaining outer membrane lipid asymmetry permease subunit MlaE